MLFNKNGFTLTELLITLSIIGAIAVLTIPSLMYSVNTKMNITETKNFVTSIKQLIEIQKIKNRTSDIINTDFASPEKLFVNSNFSIVKTCSASDAQSKCWKTSDGNISYSAINGNSVDISGLDQKDSVILKNGSTFSYSVSDEGGTFLFDVNGIKSPNIVGRDLFIMKINSEGSIIIDDSTTLSTLASNCTTQGKPEDCLNYLIRNNWNMDY